MKLSAIVTCHESDPNPVVRMLKAQTVPPYEILLETSGECTPLIETVDYHQHVHNENDFGYRKRNRLALRATGEWIGFFCHDDSYHPRYIEMMMERGQGREVVYCEWNDHPDCNFEACQSTLGNFFINRDTFMAMGGFSIAEEVGFTDALLIETLREMRVHLARLNVVLYYHNVPYDNNIVPTTWGELKGNVRGEYQELSLIHI